MTLRSYESLPATDSPSVDVRAVVDGHLPKGPPRHQQEPGPRQRVDNGRRAPRSEYGNLRTARSTSVGPQGRLALEHVHEAVEVGRDRVGEGSAPGQLDIQD